MATLRPGKGVISATPPLRRDWALRTRKALGAPSTPRGHSLALRAQPNGLDRGALDQNLMYHGEYLRTLDRE